MTGGGCIAAGVLVAVVAVLRASRSPGSVVLGGYSNRDSVVAAVNAVLSSVPIDVLTSRRP